MEQTFQQGLESSYSTMGETTFKALRRALPITKQRMEWGKLQSYNVGAAMSGKDKK